MRWAPTWLQLADALTKENADAMDLLRAAMRKGQYQLCQESVMMEAAATEREARKARKPAQGQTAPVAGVWFAASASAVPMVKVPVQGFKEGEIRALFEKYVEGISESEQEFNNRLVQNMGQCKMRAPLEKVNEKLFRGAGMEVTYTYTKNTNMVQVQTGAAMIDCAAKQMEQVLIAYSNMLREADDGGGWGDLGVPEG